MIGSETLKKQLPRCAGVDGKKGDLRRGGNKEGAKRGEKI